jgi:hypothetical protein
MAKKKDNCEECGGELGEDGVCQDCGCVKGETDAVPKEETAESEDTEEDEEEEEY